jgi:hypothetical protein
MSDKSNKSNNNKRVLSFDVGIKNLAYCIIDFLDDDFKIIDWGVINLADNRSKCEHITYNKSKKTEKNCEMVAKYKYIDLNNKEVCYCNRHIKNIKIETETIKIKNKFDSKKNKDKVCDYNKCKKNAEYDIKIIDGCYCEKHMIKMCRDKKYICEEKKCNNFVTSIIYDNNKKPVIGWCDDHCNDKYMKGLEKYKKRRIKKISSDCNKIKLDVLCESMYKKFNDNKLMLDVNEVLIENQPTRINPNMKTISTFIYSYFVNEGRIKKKENKIKNIKFCAPSKKITVGGTKITDEVNNTSKEKTYKATKQIAVKICKSMIEHEKNYLDIFNKYKKKDDLADAFLQAVIKNFSVIPEKYSDKISKLKL